MQLGSIKNLCQESRSEGSLQMVERVSPRISAQASLAPLGTCLRVVIFNPKIESRDGRVRELPEGTDVDVDVDNVTLWSADTVVEWSPTAETVVTVVGVGGTYETLGLRGVDVWVLKQFSRLWGRQPWHDLPTFTQEQFLQRPDRLHLQQGMSGRLVSIPVWNLIILVKTPSLTR